MLADYGKKRLERQNSSQDPRLVDMDDNKGRSLDSNDNTDKQKTEELQSKALVNCVPNGHYKGTSPSFSLGRTSQPSARAVLEPIPMVKLSRSRRLSSEAELQFAESCSKNDSEAQSSSDELIKKMFNNSCMDALNFLKKAFDEKLVSSMSLKM